MKSIYIVDDIDVNLVIAEQALEKYYRVFTMPSARKMFAMLEKIVPDMILLDIGMPDIDGFEALRQLKADERFASIPVIFLTGFNDDAAEVRGLELGAWDFITKPFSAPVLLNRIRTHLDIDDLLSERTAALIKLQNGIVYALADIVESRDNDTGGHIERTSVYMQMLIEAMLEKNVYAEELKGYNVDLLISSARLHDIGKIAIPDAILNKPGKLTPEEYDKMKTHAIEGEKIICKIIDRTGDAVFLQNAKLFSTYHHERWDGAGYPYGLKGAEIPIQGRIMAIVDVYDALVSERPYKKPFSIDQALKIITDSAGTHFDPEIVNVFLSIRDKFDNIERGLAE
jgi:putative two-component system response regulator